MNGILQHGFMCTVEAMKKRVLFSDVEEHVGVDVLSILVENRRKEKGEEKGEGE